MPLALLDRLVIHAATRPDESAYTDQAGDSLTWRELADAVNAFSAELPRDGVVLLCGQNQIDYPIAFLAVLAAGCDVFPVSCEIAEPELQRAAEQSNAIAIIGNERVMQALPGLRFWDLDALTPSPGIPGEGGVRVLSPGPKGPRITRTFTNPSQIIREDSCYSWIEWVSRQNPHPTLSRNTGRGKKSSLLSRDTGRGKEPSLLLQSSGTTGLPKIVRRSGRSLDAAAAAIAEAVGFLPSDHVLAAVPLTHSYGLEHGLLAPVWAGSRVHLCRGLDLPGVVSELAKGQITLFPAVPAVFEMLAAVADAPDARSLRTAYSAGAPLPQGVIDRFADRFGVRIGQLYGATEIGSVTFNSPHEEPFAPASVGKPMRGVQIRILDVAASVPLPAGEEGHVAVRADSMFDGYLHDDPKSCFKADISDQTATEVADPDAESATSVAALKMHGSRETASHLIDGYFPTGDLGRVDSLGRLFITGRLKLLIDVGGMKVNPIEVETVLQQHPRVGDCVVVPIRQSETVHRLKAIVTPRDPKHPPGGEELRAFAKSRLSAYKVPRVFEVRDDLPRSATGKVLRHLVEV